MKKLPVDLDELALALETNDSGHDLAAYWFDTGTGDVLFVSDDLEEDQELRAQIGEDASGRVPDDGRLRPNASGQSSARQIGIVVAWSQAISPVRGFSQ